MDMRASGRFRRWRVISSSTCELCCEPTMYDRNRVVQGLLTRPSIQRTLHLQRIARTGPARNRPKLQRPRDDAEGCSRVDDDRRSGFARWLLREFPSERAVSAGARDCDSGSEDAKGRVRAVRTTRKKGPIGDLPDARRARMLLAQTWASRGIHSLRFRQSAK